MIKEWEATEPKNWDDYEFSQQALKEGRWKEVKDASTRLISSNSQAWRNAGQKFQNEAEAGEKKEATPIDEQGKLAPGESSVQTRADNKTLFRDYEFNGKEGESVIIGLQGSFDTKLYLISPDKLEIELSDDINSRNRNSSLTADLRQTGIYKVRVNAYYLANDPKGQGNYRLIVNRKPK